MVTAATQSTAIRGAQAANSSWWLHTPYELLTQKHLGFCNCKTPYVSYGEFQKLAKFFPPVFYSASFSLKFDLFYAWNSDCMKC